MPQFHLTPQSAGRITAPSGCVGILWARNHQNDSSPSLYFMLCKPQGPVGVILYWYKEKMLFISKIPQGQVTSQAIIIAYRKRAQFWAPMAPLGRRPGHKKKKSCAHLHALVYLANHGQRRGLFLSQNLPLAQIYPAGHWAVTKATWASHKSSMFPRPWPHLCRLFTALFLSEPLWFSLLGWDLVGPTSAECT